MNRQKTLYFLLGLFVVVSAIFVGTALWTGLGPWPKRGGWDQKPLEGLAKLGTVPEFALVERSGAPRGLDSLKGQIWVADFIYTSCTDTCPVQSAEMAKLQDEWTDRNGFKLVSFSVDPERDTPQVLSRYAERFKANPKSWWFLTGGKEEISRLVQEGFHLSAVPAADEHAKKHGVILHSSRFVLVDRAGIIRGYYESRDAAALKRLRKDLATLANEKE